MLIWKFFFITNICFTVVEQSVEWISSAENISLLIKVK
jgi:hypothetical protein